MDCSKVLIAILIACASFALRPALHAVTPAPDGGYPNANTAEGEDALLSLAVSSGVSNTGLGYHALHDIVEGDGNTAVGSTALEKNQGNKNTGIGNEALSRHVNGESNTAVGVSALKYGTAGDNNTALGVSALLNNNASDNTATGASALASNTSGAANTACGVYALYDNTTGDYNTAVGFGAATSVTTSDNTAVGFSALSHNTAGTQNTATGSGALVGSIDDTGNPNSTGSANTATGFESLFKLTNGQYNVADGWSALYSNTSGFLNTATGASALTRNTTGIDNTATGANALFYNVGGNYNTADGASALQKNTSGNYNTATGLNSLLNNSTGSNNVALGYKAGFNLTTGSNNIFIGANVLGTTSDANITRIGNTTQKKTFIGGISGKTVASGVGVIINSSGQLGTVQSSARYKDDIKPMDKASEAILALKPVTFHYKEELDPDKIPQFGLIAEEIEKVNPDLIVRDEDGKVMTVRYDAINAMLLNEFLKEHRKVHALETTVSQQQKEFQTRLAEQQIRIDALTAVVQKVSNSIESEKSTPPRLIANNQSENK